MSGRFRRADRLLRPRQRLERTGALLSISPLHELGHQAESQRKHEQTADDLTDTDDLAAADDLMHQVKQAPRRQSWNKDTDAQGQPRGRPLVAFQRVVDEYEETATVYEARLRIAELTVGADAFKKP